MALVTNVKVFELDRLAQQGSDFASGTLNVMKVESVTGLDEMGHRIKGQKDVNVEIVM